MSHDGQPVHRAFLLAAAVFGVLGVAAGAFAAHGLEGGVEPRMLAAFRTAAHYQVLHALALLGVALLAPRLTGPWPRVAGWAFAAGIVLFSGSLYLMVMSGERWLGAVTPFGGVAFLAGWGALGVSAFSGARDRHG